jgi:hypothetical protein
MGLYKPSQLWTEEEIEVPSYGTIKKTPKLDLEGHVESWLRMNGYIEVIEPNMLTTGPLTETDPAPQEFEKAEDQDTPETLGGGEPPTLPAMESGEVVKLEDQVIEFLNSAEPAEITSIRGITGAVADVLIAGRPLDKQRVAEVLSDRQRDAVSKFVEAKQQESK